MSSGESAEHFLTLSRAELAVRFSRGAAVDPEVLAGWLYRGVSLGLPSWVDALAWKTFGKAFHRDVDASAIRGWNVRLRQTGIDGPIEALQKHGEDFTFGHFRVVSIEESRLPRLRPEGVLLDYGAGGNPAFDVTSRVRDPVVSLDEGSAERLLGWTYLDLGAFAVPTPSYFLLTRCEPVRHVPSVPRPR